MDDLYFNLSQWLGKVHFLCASLQIHDTYVMAPMGPNWCKCSRFYLAIKYFQNLSAESATGSGKEREDIVSIDGSWFESISRHLLMLSEVDNLSNGSQMNIIIKLQFEFN